MVSARRQLSHAARSPLTWVIGIWLVFNLLWLRMNRWTRYAELDEAAYARLAISFERQTSWPDRWRVLTTEGFHGPLQALFTFVPMKLTAGDIRVLIVLNILLTVIAALATASLTSAVAGRQAGMVAGSVILLLPGVVQFSHNALTATMPMAFMAVALAALARSGGLKHSKWCVAAGIAAGCMVVGRSMAVGFLPALAVAGLGWAWSSRTRPLVVARNGLLLAASAVAVAGWWWAARWPELGDYLFKGGSSDTARVEDPVDKVLNHITEIRAMVGGGFVLGLTTVLILLVLRSRRSMIRLIRRRRDPAVPPPKSEPSAELLVVWPLVASVVMGLVTLGMSTAYGVGFVLPLLPALVAAVVAGARTALIDPMPAVWKAWAGGVLALSLFAVITMPNRGLDAPMVWCGPGQTEVRPYCSIRDNGAGERWRRTNDRVADRIAIAQAAAFDYRPDRVLSVAMTRRDLGLSDNMVSLSMEVRHRVGINLAMFFVEGRSVDDQLRDVVEGADLVVVIEDLGGEVVLSKHSPSPEQVLDAVRAAGFQPCEAFETPDGRLVTVVRSSLLPRAACGPTTVFGP